MKRAVIMGAGGMLGATLAHELIDHGMEVLALVRRGADGRRNLPEHPLLLVEPCELADLHAFQMPKGTKPFDVMYHFAWEGTFGPTRDNAFLQSQNIRHTLDAISLAHRLGCTRFVGAGTQAEAGRVPDGEKLRPETPSFPVSGYGIAKLSAGLLGQLHAKSLGLAFHWVRILSVYGPMEKPHSLTMSTILALLKGQEVHFTKGEQLWDFLYSEDAARAFRLIGEKGRDGQTYVLGSGQTIALAEAFATICRAVSPSARAGIGDLPYPDGQTMYLCADISKLTEDTGFLPQVPYAEGIRKTIDWVKEQL